MRACDSYGSLCGVRAAFVGWARGDAESRGFVLLEPFTRGSLGGSLLAKSWDLLFGVDFALELLLLFGPKAAHCTRLLPRHAEKYDCRGLIIGRSNRHNMLPHVLPV